MSGMIIKKVDIAAARRQYFDKYLNQLGSKKKQIKPVHERSCSHVHNMFTRALLNKNVKICESNKENCPDIIRSFLRGLIQGKNAFVIPSQFIIQILKIFKQLYILKMTALLEYCFSICRKCHFKYK